ncbi:MAG: hypothetical protein Rubg2KO_24610 [Rubricoccaceae bacterium]
MLRTSVCLATLAMAVVLFAVPSSSQVVITIATTADENERNDELTLREALLVLHPDSLDRSELTPAEQARITGTISTTPAGGQNEIRFDLPGAGPHVIRWKSFTPDWPAVRVPISIDGLSQPGAECADGPAGVTVEIEGSPGDPIFDLYGGGHRVRGLSLTDGSIGVRLTGGTVGSEVTCLLSGQRLDGGLDEMVRSDVEVNGGQDNQIGGTTLDTQNVLLTGIALVDGTHGNVVEGNTIGLALDGTSVEGARGGASYYVDGRGSFRGGVVLYDDGGDNRIGGADPSGLCQGPCNRIVAGEWNGIYIKDSRAANRILGNAIGRDADGAVRARTDVGMIVAAAGQIIGGAEPGEGNVVSRAWTDGLQLEAPTEGVVIAGNQFLQNGEAGFRLVDASLTGWALVGNRILANQFLGIDLGPEGIQENDPLDADAGRPNAPALSSIPSLISGGQARVNGTLESLASTTFRIEAFSNPPGCDISGYGEGGTFLGGFQVTTDANGLATFDETLAASGASDGEPITLTATGPEGTSEFSQCGLVPDGAVFTVTTTADSGPGSLRAAITAANESPNTGGVLGPPDRIEFAIPASDAGCDGSGVCTIQPTSELTVVREGVFIDGLTQAGASCDAWPATLKVVLNGDLAGDNYGLQLRSSRSTVQGLVVNGFGPGSFRYAGIRILFDPGVRNADRNRIYCNYIGTDVTGTQRVPNETGIELNGDDNLIGGPEPGQRNLISGNGLNNIEMVANNSGGKRNVIQGNFIGPDVTGTKALPATEDFHLEDGVKLFNNFGDAGDNLIGGTDHSPWTCDRACNLISGNGNEAINIAGPFRTVIQGNFIGTDITGTKALEPPTIYGFGPGVDGFSIPGTIVGGTEPGAGNLISGIETGIELTQISGGRFTNGQTAGVTIQGNRIGTDRTGTLDIGNTQGGIILYNGLREVRDVIIGGTVEGAGNIIAYNNLGGVVLDGAQHVGNSILGNSIFGNRRGEDAFGNVYDTEGLGIDLSLDGITANDPLDADDGGNEQMNYPVLTPIVTTTSAGSASVQGTYSGTPNETFRLEFFASSQCHPSRFGEGERFMGHLDVTTGGDGLATFSGSFTADVPGGWVVTSTATNSRGSTSEFSQCAEFPENGLVVTTTDNEGEGSLRDAILVAKGMPDVQTITFALPGDGPHAIQIPDNLPLINDPTHFDGLSQPGASCGPEGRSLRIGIDGMTTARNGLTFVRGSAGSSFVGLAIGRTTRNGTYIQNLYGGRASLRYISQERGLQIECNHFGLDPTGTQDWPIEDAEFDRSTYGLFAAVHQSQVGSPGRGNVFANATWGLLLQGDTNRVQSNYVGLDLTGTARPNRGWGLWIDEGSEGNLIGGTSEGEGNTIAFNMGDGVQLRDKTDSVVDAPTLNNRISGNSIYGNGGIGINLCTQSQRFIANVCDEATANDPGDADSGAFGGPNRWQNYPVIASIGVTDGTFLQATYHVPTDTSRATYPLSVEFFLADDMGQGKVYLGRDTYTADDHLAGGDKVATFTLVAPYVADGMVIATATDAAGNTSEFGAPNVAVGSERDPSLPEVFAIDPPWPNPVRQRATVRVALPEASELTVEVFDALGRRVRQLEDADRPAGWHELALDADGLASGVYLVRMVAGEGADRFTAVRRLTVVR